MVNGFDIRLIFIFGVVRGEDIGGIVSLKIWGIWLMIINIVDFVVKLLIIGFDINVVKIFSCIVFIMI